MKFLRENGIHEDDERNLRLMAGTKAAEALADFVYSNAQGRKVFKLSSPRVMVTITVEPTP